MPGTTATASRARGGNGATATEAAPPPPSQEINQTPITVIIRGVTLDAWIRINADRTRAFVMVRKHGRPQDGEYPIFALTDRGECYRCPNVPFGWGFRLTRDRKVKEVR